MRRHGEEPCIDDAAFALAHLVYGGLHVVTAGEAFLLDGFKHHQCGTPVALGAVCVGFQPQYQPGLKWCQPDDGFGSAIRGLGTVRRPEPLLDGVARQTGASPTGMLFLLSATYFFLI